MKDSTENSVKAVKEINSLENCGCLFTGNNDLPVKMLVSVTTELPQNCGKLAEREYQDSGRLRNNDDDTLAEIRVQPALFNSRSHFGFYSHVKQTLL